MIELLNKIIEYITYDVWLNEDQYNEEGEKDLKYIISWIKRYDISFKIGIEDYELKKFEKNIQKLREIREVYHQGLPFVRNKTKGYEKGFRNLVFTSLKDEIKRGNMDYAKERAIRHLKWVKKWKSERTYYRHKKIIKELGIEI